VTGQLAGLEKQRLAQGYSPYREGGASRKYPVDIFSDEPACREDEKPRFSGYGGVRGALVVKWPSAAYSTTKSIRTFQIK